MIKLDKEKAGGDRVISRLTWANLNKAEEPREQQTTCGEKAFKMLEIRITSIVVREDLGMS